jgi:hypothetical protein
MRPAAVATLLGAIAAALLLAPAAPAKPGHCDVELFHAGRLYTPWRVNMPRLGPKLPGRAAIRCERSVVCKRDAECVSVNGKVLASVRVRRVPGVDEQDAVADAVTRQVFVDPKRCTLTDTRQLRCGDPAPHDPEQTPPPARLLATPELSLRLGFEYCWTAPAGPDLWVTGCPLFLPPWVYPRAYPLIVAEAGATLRISLGFEPELVQVAIVRESGVYSAVTPTPASTLAWQIPDLRLLGTSFLDVYAVRLYGPGRDFVHYVARLRLAR